MVYVDTSAFLAVLDADDANHGAAKEIWASLLADDVQLVVNNYVLVETVALAQSRLGVLAARDFHEVIVPLLEVDWVSAEQHLAAMTTLLVANRRRLSLVDCASFATAHRYGIRRVFAFDAHFAEQGFACLPESAPT